MHWKKDGDFLVARSATYLWDNLQEVPNRLLDRWSDRRRQRGETSFEDLLEMASLTDVQLSSQAGGQVVTHCRDLPEWRLLARAGYSARGMGAGFPWLLRALAGMPAAVRAQVLHERGLAVSDLTPQPQGEVIRALQQWNYQPLELSRARIHIDFVPAGRYVWTPPHERFSTEAYYALPVVSAKSPEQALLLAGPIDPRAEPSEVHRTEGVLALFVYDYQGRTSSQGRPE
ncbi:MAG: hypothetical protein K0Q72_5056 [Armatimonadetes bacterium]|nr:hypothetical protein [Armatimonadota bacterium]